MDRLTYRGTPEMTEDGLVVPSYSDYPTRRIIGKLAEYEDAEEQGLLLRLPCKVGDTVWYVGNEFVNDYEVRRFIVDETGIDCIQIAKEIDGKDYWNSFSIDDIGKNVFLTKEEAENAFAKKTLSLKKFNSEMTEILNKLSN